MCKSIIPQEQQPPAKKERKRDIRLQIQSRGIAKKQKQSNNNDNFLLSNNNNCAFLQQSKCADTLEILVSAKQVVAIHILGEVNALTASQVLGSPALRKCYLSIFESSLDDEAIQCKGGKCRERVKKLVFYTLLNDFYDAFSKDPEAFLNKEAVLNDQQQKKKNWQSRQHRLAHCIQSSLKLMINRVSLEIGTLKYGL